MGLEFFFLAFILLPTISPIFIKLIGFIIEEINFAKENKEYEKSSYYQITHLPYKTVRKDIGKYGEYLIYKHLNHYEKEDAKFLFNIYVPKSDNETSEIDVLMINSKGLFVFESKNYSGWIFGNENQPNWYQTLPIGKRRRSHKESFYNPIWQNQSHIKNLKTFLNEDLPIYSIIVFSDRCELKSIPQKNRYHIINRKDIKEHIRRICDLVPEKVIDDNKKIEIYEKLYPYTQLTEEEKIKHVEKINEKILHEAKSISDFSNKVNPTDEITTNSTHIELEQSEKKDETASLDALNPIEKNIEFSDFNSLCYNDETPVEHCPEILETFISVNNTESEEQQLKCPQCGAELVIRTARYGVNAGKQFYGCSNYPRCKYIQNIKDQTADH